MGELGDVFEAVEVSAEVPRGPDLEVSVQVPRRALGRAAGWPVAVPAALPHAGERVARYVGDDETPGTVCLHLAADLPARARLRLRGAGGLHPDGAPGDLFVTVSVVEDPVAPTRWLPWVVAAAVAAVAAAWAALH